MAWPTGAVDTTNMDAGTDNVSLARPAILDMANKTNQLIAADPTGNITIATAIANAANATANAANVTINGADARYGSGMFNLTAVASATGNLTMTVTGPLKVDFRNPTASNGTPITVSVPGNLSLTVPNPANLGNLVNQTAKLNPFLAYNGGNVTMGIASASGVPLDESISYNITAVNGSSNSAFGIYGSAATLTPIKLLGSVTANMSSLGNWSGASIKVQPAGGSAPIVGTPLTNITSVTRDQVLMVGETVTIDISAQTSVPLNIATSTNQKYELEIVADGNTGSSGHAYLNPNNQTYTNCFYLNGMVASGGSSSSLGNYANGFWLVYNGDVREASAKISTRTTSKTVKSKSLGYIGPGMEWFDGTTVWQATASSNGVGDTTTAWTSLGTVVFPVSTTGYITIKRVK